MLRKIMISPNGSLVSWKVKPIKRHTHRVRCVACVDTRRWISTKRFFIERYVKRFLNEIFRSFVEKGQENFEREAVTARKISNRPTRSCWAFLLLLRHRTSTLDYKKLWAARDTSQLQSTLINENYLKKSLTQKHNNLHVDVGHKKQQNTKLFGAQVEGLAVASRALAGLR